jgi:hypothetical protein
LRGRGRNPEDTRQLSEVMKANIRLQQQQEQNEEQGDQGTGEDGNVEKLVADAVEDASKLLPEHGVTMHEVDPFEEDYY